MDKFAISLGKFCRLSLVPNTYRPKLGQKFFMLKNSREQIFPKKKLLKIICRVSHFD